VKYQATDILNRTANSTITPTVTAPAITVVDDTKTGPYDTNQVIAVLTNDTPAAQWDPLSVKLCGLANPSATPPVVAETPNTCSKISLTVTGEGTYTVNTDGTVTFDPLSTFTGQVQTPVTYQVTDVLGRTADANITPTVLPPPPPTASPETKLLLPGSSVAFTTITGTSGLATGTGLATTGATATCLFTPSTTTCDADNSVTITGEGTYVLDPATGIVTFTALSSALSGTKPSITYRVTDIVGQTATSTLTPIIPDPPAATNDVSSGPYDTNQAINPLSNDSFSSLTPAVKLSLKLCGLDPLQTPNSCDKTTLVVPNEGSYTVNPTTGVVTFDPLPSFTGTVATPPTYQVADSVGRYVNAIITPTVSAPDAPTAKPETKLVLPGATISFTTTTGASGLATGTGLATSGPTATCLFTPGTTTCDADNSVTIVGEGTYVLDPATGIVAFTASASIMPGTKTPITYRVTDALGKTAISTLTPIVPAPPTATNDAISDGYDVNQTYTPLANDSFSSLAPVSNITLKLCGVEPVQKPNDCTKSVVTVPNEGTYTLNADGTVTFDPLPTFSGTATPVVYQVADSLGRFVNATITPTVAPPPVPAASLDTGKAKQGSKITLSPWLNDDAGTIDSTGEKLKLVPTSVRLCGITTLEKKDAPGTTGPVVTCNLTTLKTADGTYTVDVKTGKVSFVHKKGFSGTVKEPVKYSIANSFKGAAGPGIATGVLIPTIVPTSVPSVTLGDKVWRDLNGDGYQGPGDGGIEGVTVKLLTVKGKVVKDLFGKTVKPVVSDVNGAFRFTGLPGGRYKLIVTYPPNFRPTIPDRPGRLKNSSTTQAITKVMKIGQTDLSLDFGMVPKMTSGLAHTM
jgi:CshA-type fibril repeat protein